ncbi:MULTISPECIES: hypothetical protein [unclassified Pseudonocardia]|uniref:hypothetical protein n=1 Tax=unclassified Pseudonocardia TaxID=2619320 RepID=UPI0001FFE411|nr:MULTISPECIES: hypothetical protein [unclassified Pseudonocardia]ALE73517.1 hypothetical protein FRP1_11405 [Pseudonocardia sp. EC080625-04]ALL76957.1 hypothetical protein AD006_19550 [Pseudonocardia sp. EC080610-09]ALL83988.1 hypothetical protein AD017_27390 [Pseudonocardia sp. EC080619-01]OLM18579.1 hypothetical protein Ae707Ps1_2838c [Pseudonocardia sp. Ae707_Ps1]
MNPTTNRRRNRAPWVLALLTTLCAELTFTAVAVPFTWLLVPLLMVMYGAGVLVLREAVVRVGGGWPSLVLMGVAYQIAEDGLGLQALTSPRMYGAADWGLRALGVNWTYWESQIGIHVVLSVLVPIAITDLLFPAQRARPYLGDRGLAGTGVLAVVGVLGLRHLISATEDPGYRTPWGFTLLFVALIVALGLVALTVLPRLRTAAGRPAARTAPRPGVVGFVSGYLTMAFLTTLLPLGLGSTMLLGDLMSPVQRLIIAPLTAVAFGLLVLRWQAGANWGDRHRIWLFGGILVSHTAFMMPGSPTSALVGALTIAAEVYLLTRLAGHLRQRGSVTARSDR